MTSLETLHSIISEGEVWLTNRVIHYAKQRGYTPYTSTLEEAWRASVRGLSEPLLATLADGRELTVVSAEADYARDPIAFYGIEAARRHRTRGITLGLFLGLMKGYRHAYLDLVSSVGAAIEEQREWLGLVENFFDRMEVGFCDEWASKPADQQLDQLQAQNRLIINEKNKYLTIFESLNDPVFLVGETGEVENMNHAAVTLFGLTKAPGAGYYGSKEQVDLAALLGFAPAATGALACEREIDTQLGRRWFDVRTQPMLDVSEKYLGTVVILVDITEHRKAKTDAEAANRAKSSFLAAMSHEIRTPIHGILGLADLLRRKPLDAEAGRFVDAIARSGELLSAIVSDILDYSKIEAGVFELERVTFSLASVIDDVVAIMHPLAKRKPDLALDITLGEPPLLNGDPAKIKQILLNLLGNALKFTERGRVGLAVDTVDGADNRCVVRFVVVDTGIGIAPDRLAAIFEPFTQSDPTITRRYGGTGLGLAVCRALAERLGGRIEAESWPGDGSRFVVTIPFDLAADDLSSRTAPASAPDAADRRGLDVLIVEDNEVNALVACGLLERAGHRPVVAIDGQSALDLASTRRFDVVLMDLRLPDIDGREVTRRIRALEDPTLAGVPVIALSAQLLKGDVERCLAVGVTDFLSKPFRADQLDALFSRVLGTAAGGIVPRHPPEDRPDPVPADLIDASVLSGHVEALGLPQTERIVAAWRAGAEAARQGLRDTATDDRAKVAAIAHSLKGSSRHVGLAALSLTAADVEQQAMRSTGPLDSDVSGLADMLTRSMLSLDHMWSAMAERQPAKT